MMMMMMMMIERMKGRDLTTSSTLAVMLDENMNAGVFRLLCLSGVLPGSNLSDPMTVFVSRVFSSEMNLTEGSATSVADVVALMHGPVAGLSYEACPAHAGVHICYTPIATLTHTYTHTHLSLIHI